ncbi:unannotated protein [freshwater metagenome]|jgi:hypothetical protein|uniref:Unannotated protein n=1 Tax=freshwater metagenome TaxID=449393 RepID=A0A6J6CMH6_9ZZZZ|nr:hypothetical protein [Actinomycetota bacterium]MTA81099.1 hypothetical protein [Actinomycetota bacterium]
MFSKMRVAHTQRHADISVGGATYCDAHRSTSIRLVESTGQRPFRQISGRAVANRRLDSR